MTNLQINSKLRNKIVLGSILSVFAYLLICRFAYSSNAQTQLPLTVVPPKQEVLINPGENFSTSVKFLNQGDSPITGTLTVSDFIVTDSKGTPVFLDNPQVVGTTTIPVKYSAAKWITALQDTVTIAAKGNVAIPIRINVPKNAAPGGRYAAVLFQPSGNLTLGNQESAQEIPISIRLASLIYIRIAGPVSENATVTQFSAPNFLEYGPINIVTKIFNQGDYHIAPQGNISLKDMFGRTVNTVDLETKNIFPGTSRSFESQLGSKLMFGKFTATLSATYGDNGQLLTSDLTLWVFPWKVTLAILLGIIILILFIVLGYKKIVKKEEELVEELKEEKSELERLKEKFKDQIHPQGPVNPPTPPTDSPVQ